MPLSDAELLRRAQEADKHALGEIYDTYSQRVYVYAYRLSGEATLAQEVMAETFYRFLLALRAGGGPREHLAAYLFRVAHNLIADHYRKRSRTELSLDESLVADTADPDDEMAEAHAQARARAALWQLTPEQRQVITLKYLEGLSNEEVAVTLDKPVGAVKSLQSRALAALRRVLSKETEGALR
ncbi:MAG: hypothetical protein A2W37_04685 [Chloroflexi bacterium RBG_16_63_12]|nr:MAG: hypothetical protein A2W37_04685 [Chloroflexi bacterium RBG_16_63_12]